MSWYDVSTGPNLALYNHVRKTAHPDVADKQYAVIAPVLHCSYTRATENTVVGERSMGDAAAQLQRADLRLVRLLFERPHRRQRHNEMAEGPLFHHGQQQVAVFGPMAAGRCRAYEVLSRKRRKSEHVERRWPSRCRTARLGHAGPFRIRPDEPRPVIRRQRLLYGQRRPGRLFRSAKNGRAARHSCLHLGCSKGGDRTQRPDRPHALCFVRR